MLTNGRQATGTWYPSGTTAGAVTVTTPSTVCCTLGVIRRAGSSTVAVKRSPSSAPYDGKSAA